jgi:NADH dehydrogenase
MTTANNRFVTVFGGTGFLGRRVVRHIRKHGFSVRIASRRPDRGQRLFALEDPQLQSIEANIHDERSVADAVAGAHGVVNAVSLYIEHGQETFQSVHVESAQRVAAQARLAGVERLVHVSGIGSDAFSPSLYIRKRGEGELAVRAAFANATVVRPAVMFGPDDAFLTTLLRLLSQLPIYPMFGRGLTKLQPAYVEDVAEAIVRTLKQTDGTFEFGGPRVYSYEELIKVVACAASLKPRLIPIPYVAWRILAWFAKILPRPPITQNQVELMQIDTVASSELSGFKTLGITPVAVEEVLQEILWDH